MEVLIAQILNGLSLGSIYVLLVTCFNLLLLVAMVIHFSFPVVVVLSMYAAWFVMTLSGSVSAGIAAAVFSAVVVNILTAPVFSRIMKKRGEVDINATMVVSMGIGMIVTDILSHTANSGFPVSFPEALTKLNRGSVLQAGLISISTGQILTLISGTAAVLIVFVIMYKTRQGRAFRAIAEDPAGAGIAGIPVLKTGMISWALTGLLGGVTAVLMAILLGSASSGLGDQLGHKVLAVSIIAGLGNLPGGLVVALFLGIIEALIQGYWAGSWSNAVSFVIMLVVILIKPKGIFGSKI